MQQFSLQSLSDCRLPVECCRPTCHGGVHPERLLHTGAAVGHRLHHLWGDAGAVLLDEGLGRGAAGHGSGVQGLESTWVSGWD